MTMLRIWTMLVDTGVAGFPNSFSDNVQLGKRTFAAREAYELINDNTLQSIHIQQNTDEPLNIPIGLYSNRAIAISGHTAFGIPTEDFLFHANSVGKIFNNESTWNEIDQSCKTNSIDKSNVLSINDFIISLYANLYSFKICRLNKHIPA